MSDPFQSLQRLVSGPWLLSHIRTMVPINFATPRLNAEKLDASHLGDLTALHLDPEVSRYIGGVRSPESTTDYLARNLAHWVTHEFGLWVFRTNDGLFAGRAGIRHLTLNDKAEVEIAYTFRRELWGHGLATEVAEVLVQLWRSRLSIPSLVGIACVEHAASRRVLEKTGFAYECDTIDVGEDVAVYRLWR